MPRTKLKQFTVFVEISGDCDSSFEVYRWVWARDVSGAKRNACKRVKRDFNLKSKNDDEAHAGRVFAGHLKELY